jgi:hypothetical protein
MRIAILGATGREADPDDPAGAGGPLPAAGTPAARELAALNDIVALAALSPRRWPA